MSDIKNNKKPLRVKAKNMEKDNKETEGKKPNVLQRLYRNTKLRAKVDNALDEGRTYNYIVELCAEYDFEISSPSLTRYKNKRNEAIEKGLDLEDLVDKRKKSGDIIHLDGKESDTTKDEDDVEYSNRGNGNGGGGNKLMSNAHFLQKIIDKASATVDELDLVDLPMGIKALEALEKVTGGQTQGVSMHAIKELKLRQVAKENAMIEVMMEYIPKEDRDTILQAIEEKEQEFYRDMDLTKEGQELMEALDGTDFSL